MTLKLHNSIPKDPYTKQLCFTKTPFSNKKNYRLQVVLNSIWSCFAADDLISNDFTSWSLWYSSLLSCQMSCKNILLFHKDNHFFPSKYSKMQKPLLFPLSLDFDHHFQFLVDELVVNLIYRKVLKRLGFQSQNPPRLCQSVKKAKL